MHHQKRTADSASLLAPSSLPLKISPSQSRISAICWGGIAGIEEVARAQ